MSSTSPIPPISPPLSPSSSPAIQTTTTSSAASLASIFCATHSLLTPPHSFSPSASFETNLAPVPPIKPPLLGEISTGSPASPLSAHLSPTSQADLNQCLAASTTALTHAALLALRPEQIPKLLGRLPSETYRSMTAPCLALEFKPDELLAFAIKYPSKELQILKRRLISLPEFLREIAQGTWNDSLECMHRFSKNALLECFYSMLQTDDVHQIQRLAQFFLSYVPSFSSEEIRTSFFILHGIFTQLNHLNIEPELGEALHHIEDRLRIFSTLERKVVEQYLDRIYQRPPQIQKDFHYIESLSVLFYLSLPALCDHLENIHDFENKERVRLFLTDICKLHGITYSDTHIKHLIQTLRTFDLAAWPSFIPSFPLPAEETLRRLDTDWKGLARILSENTVSHLKNLLPQHVIEPLFEKRERKYMQSIYAWIIGLLKSPFAKINTLFRLISIGDYCARELQDYYSAHAVYQVIKAVRREKEFSLDEENVFQRFKLKLRDSGWATKGILPLLELVESLEANHEQPAWHEGKFQWNVAKEYGVLYQRMHNCEIPSQKLLQLEE